MASSSKRRASSGKQTIGGKTRVISVGRNDALPRKGNVSAGPRKSIARSPVDAAKEPLPEALARSNKKPRKMPQTETSSSRIETARPRRRSSAKLKKPAAMEVRPAAADASGTVASVDAPESEALPSVEAEVEVEALAIVAQATITEPPFAAAPHVRKRALATAAARLLSMLCRWTGVRR